MQITHSRLKKFFNRKNILITGGTGSFGNACTKILLKYFNLKKIIIYSRDEMKQYEMAKKFPQKNIRYFIGDVRDKDRLILAMKNVDYAIHAAALKHVSIAEYNPMECIKTNVYGAENVINASMICNVKRVLALSTDKATNPINLYGATKLCAEKLFINANNLVGKEVGKEKIKFSVVRYGNIINSRGSVLPHFINLLAQGKNTLPITDKNMTRFFITQPHAVNFVLESLLMMERGEVFVPKAPSLKIVDLAKSLNQSVRYKIIGIRPGEKIHELLCSNEESKYTKEMNRFFIIIQDAYFLSKSKIYNKGKKVKEDFEYSSKNNSNFLNFKQVKKFLKKAKIKG